MASWTAPHIPKISYLNHDIIKQCCHSNPASLLTRLYFSSLPLSLNCHTCNLITSISEQRFQQELLRVGLYLGRTKKVWNNASAAPNSYAGNWSQDSHTVQTSLSGLEFDGCKISIPKLAGVAWFSVVIFGLLWEGTSKYDFVFLTKLDTLRGSGAESQRHTNTHKHKGQIQVKDTYLIHTNWPTLTGTLHQDSQRVKRQALNSLTKSRPPPSTS